MARTVDPDVGGSIPSVTGETDFERRYRALVSGDLAAAHDICSEDVVLRVPGRSRIAGSYKGPEGAVAFFDSLRELSGNTVAVSIENFATAQGKAVITQTVTARRGSRELRDHQNVLLRIESGQIAEAFVYPYDLRAHDRFWGRAPLFVEEDGDLIARAIKVGNTPEKDPGADRRVIAAAVFALIILSALVAGFNWLLTTRASQKLFASTTNIEAVRHLSLKDPMGGAEANIVPAIVRGADVTNTYGRVDIALPIRASRCAELAGELTTTCLGDEIALQAPVHVRWSNEVRLTTAIEDATTIDTGLIPEGEEGRSFSVDLVARSTTPPDLCFTGITRELRLTLVDYSGRSIHFDVPGDDTAVTCENGVKLRIGTQATAIQTSTVALRGASQVDMTSIGTSADVDGLAGKLTFVNVSTRVFDPAAHIVVTGDDPVRTTVDLGDIESRLAVSSDSVNRVLTDDGDLLPTRWEEFPQPFAAMIGALFGTLVLPDLAKGLFLARDRAVPRLLAAVGRLRRRLSAWWRARRA
jgi:ketosteroid isomerase-like protein